LTSRPLRLFLRVVQQCLRAHSPGSGPAPRFGADPEAFAPRPGDPGKLPQAALLVRVGLGYDYWLDAFANQTGEKRLMRGGDAYLDASAGIPLLELRGESFVAQRLGIPMVRLAISVGSLAGTGDYLALFDYNVATLANAPGKPGGVYRHRRDEFGGHRRRAPRVQSSDRARRHRVDLFRQAAGRARDL
jgi:hypothetical protein